MYRISMFYYKEINLHLETDHEQKMIWIHFHTMTYCWCCQSCWLENDPNPRPHHHFFEPQINCFAAQLPGWLAGGGGCGGIAREDRDHT